MGSIPTRSRHILRPGEGFGLSPGRVGVVRQPNRERRIGWQDSRARPLDNGSNPLDETRKEQDTLGVILNPAASGGKGRRLRASVEDGLRSRRIPFVLSVTTEPGHARELALGMAREGVKRILVVGGDGTIHEAANGILAVGGARPALAVVPVGTGNDFHRIIGTPRRLDAALDLLGNGRIARLDVGRALTDRGGTHFVNLLGVGLDVEVLKRRSRFRHLSGLPQYLAALIATLITFRAFSVEVVFDQGIEKVAGPTILAGITLGPSIGGGFMICPDASPEDGLMDFFFVDPLGPGQVARYIPRVIRGTHGTIPEFHLRRITRARFRRSDGEPFFFELDGELIPKPVTELNVEILPRSLPVVLPRIPE